MSDRKNDTTESGSRGVDERTISARRTAMKALTAGGIIAGVTLPERWTRPIVQAVVLPAHGQTTEDDSPPPRPSCNDAEIIVATITGSEALFVVAEYNVPGSCIDDDTSSRGVLCELISNGVTLGSENRSTAGGSCTESDAPDVGCLVSCSVAIDSGNHSVEPGDSITMRFTFEGGCVCSAINTVEIN